MRRSTSLWSRALLFAALFTLLAGGIWASLAQSSLESRAAARLEEVRDELIAVRRDLHQHPEVSGAEERTAGVVAARLRALGLRVRTGVGGHGVVGVLEGGESGPTVAFRADMDAVPSTAPDPVEFRSKTPGVRHICGHDIHTTIGLALAEAIAAVRDELAGSLMLIFQPAEETATGARAMLADDVWPDPPPKAIFAYHTAPLEVGQLATTSGVMMTGRDRVRVDLRGRGDLESAARTVRQQLSQVGSLTAMQALQPQQGEFILAQVGPPSEGQGGWTVSGMMTTSGPAASAQARRQVAEALGALELDSVTVEHVYEEKVMDGVTNDDELTDRAVASVKAVIGDEQLIWLDSLVPAFSEDFGSFQKQVPGVMFFLGVSNSEKGWVGMPHSPGYVADEEAIFVGTRAMTRVVLDTLGASQPLAGP